jgi:hypothetical protein
MFMVVDSKSYKPSAFALDYTLAFLMVLKLMHIICERGRNE